MVLLTSVQVAIKHAEELDFANVDHVLRVLSRPYEDQSDTTFPVTSGADEQIAFDASPAWASEICVSCSS